MNEGSIGHLLQPKSFRRTRVAKSARYCSASSKKAMPLCPKVDNYRVPRVTWRRCAPNNEAPVRMLPSPSFGGRSCRLGILPHRVARGAGGVRGMERATLHEKIRGNTCDLKRTKLQRVDWCQGSVMCAGVQRYTKLSFLKKKHFKSKRAPIFDDVHACFGFASSMRQFLRKQIWMPKTHGKKGGPKIEEAQLLLGSLCGQPRPNPSCAQASPSNLKRTCHPRNASSSPSQVSQPLLLSSRSRSGLVHAVRQCKEFGRN